MDVDVKFYFSLLLGTYVVFKTTKNNYVLENRINLLENNIQNLKERLSDLELFKLKCYSNEINIGRRAWDQDITDDFVDDDDLD